MLSGFFQLRDRSTSTFSLDVALIELAFARTGDVGSLSRCQSTPKHYTSVWCNVVNRIYRQFVLNLECEGFFMKDRQAVTPKSSPTQWVNYTLSEAEKDALQRWDATAEDLLAWVGTMTYEGYRFSWSWDKFSECVQVSCFCQDEQNDNFGLGLSGRHPDADKALKVLIFKHEVVMEKRWRGYLTAPKGSWG